MGKAETKEHVFVFRPEDMWHVCIVAHDLDRMLKIGHFDFGIVVGQGPRGEPIDNARRQYAEYQQGSGQTDKPAENQSHEKPLLKHPSAV